MADPTKRLITKEEVVDIAFPRANIDENLIKEKRIKAGELKHLIAVIGEDWFDELITGNQDESLSADNLAAMPFIKDLLAFYVALEVIPFMFVDMSDAGIQRQNTEFTTAATRQEKADLMTQLRADADTYKDELIRFLTNEQDADSTKYPLYESFKNVNEKVKTVGGVLFDLEDKPISSDASIDEGRSLRDC